MTEKNSQVNKGNGTGEKTGDVGESLSRIENLLERHLQESDKILGRLMERDSFLLRDHLIRIARDYLVQTVSSTEGHITALLECDEDDDEVALEILEEFESEFQSCRRIIMEVNTMLEMHGVRLIVPFLDAWSPEHHVCEAVEDTDAFSQVALQGLVRLAGVRGPFVSHCFEPGFEEFQNEQQRWSVTKLARVSVVGELSMEGSH